MNLTDLPHMTWTEFSRTALPKLKAGAREDSPQYVLCPYDSMEKFYRRVVVVTDTVSVPTVVRAPRARSNRKPAAVALPDLAALTLPLAQSIVRVGTDYIVLRQLFTDALVRDRFPSGEESVRGVAAA
ncbi:MULTISPECIES: hypothetical protein [unclassified Rhodococcus (in: high G+C Gram-positive bacteria)]|uniref:hypothetical protein n=3 Tax=Rhodococcus TaxID=1827 RepID=UPI0007D9FAC9|nr:hypothetical protein BO226_25180 [Rhodococcus sp. 2G]